MRPLSTKPEGWGLPGGRMEFANPVSITVKDVAFNEKGQILLVQEKYVPDKNPVAATEQPSPENPNPNVRATKNFEEYLRDLRNLVNALHAKKSPITWEEVRRLLDVSVPQTRSILGQVMDFLSGREPDAEGLDLFRSWNPESEEIKIILTAIREELEETGHLVRAVPVAETHSRENHKVVVCHATVLGGRIRKETKETYQVQWFSLAELPLSREEKRLLDELPEEKIRELGWHSDFSSYAKDRMYWTHKFRYLPNALIALKQRGFRFANPDEVDAFLASVRKIMALIESHKEVSVSSPA